MLTEELLRDAEMLAKEGLHEKKIYQILKGQGHSEKDIKSAIDTLKERNVAMKKIIEEAALEEAYSRRAAKKDSFLGKLFRKIF